MIKGANPSGYNQNYFPQSYRPLPLNYIHVHINVANINSDTIKNHFIFDPVQERETS